MRRANLHVASHSADAAFSSFAIAASESSRRVSLNHADAAFSSFATARSLLHESLSFSAALTERAYQTAGPYARTTFETSREPEVGFHGVDVCVELLHERVKAVGIDGGALSEDSLKYDDLRGGEEKATKKRQGD